MTKHHTLTVDLGARSYPIHIGSGIFDDAALYAPHLQSGPVVVITSDAVADLYLQRLIKSLRIDRCYPIVLPDGETTKSLGTLESIVGEMLTLGCDRQSTVIALGGGVVGDIAGFAASVFQRGIETIQVPTTLLAQVDSSVGGKTAVNHRLGKNMIGTFHQPKCVIADTDTLASLPPKEVSAGLAEVIKYGAIRDLDFFQWLEDNASSLVRQNPVALAAAVLRSCECKADVVSQDETERGQRAILNFGHTFGHAIETHSGYGSWLHGEAVAVGMVMATQMSHRLGDVDTNGVSRVKDLLSDLNLPVTPPPQMRREDFLAHMRHDKKVVAGRIRLVLLKRLGQAYVTDHYADAVLDETLTEACR